jgi:hypothetical protein
MMDIFSTWNGILDLAGLGDRTQGRRGCWWVGERRDGFGGAITPRREERIGEDLEGIFKQSYKSHLSSISIE